MAAAKKSVFGVMVVVCGAVLAAATGHARADSSDILLVNGAPPQVIPEAGAITESSALVSYINPAASQLVPAGGLAALIGLPGTQDPSSLFYVLLAEPAGPPDPNELPQPAYIGANGQPVPVSDLIIEGVSNGQVGGPFLAMISDGNPDLNDYLNLVPPGAPSNVTVLTETGIFQDITADLPFARTHGIDVEVLSNVEADTGAPLPATFWCGGALLALMAAISLRRRRSIA